MNNVIKQHAKEARAKIIADSAPAKKNNTNKLVLIYSIGFFLAFTGLVGEFTRINTLTQEFHTKEVARTLEERDYIFKRECETPENELNEKLHKFERDFNTNIYELEQIYSRNSTTNPLYKYAREWTLQGYAQKTQCKAGLDQIQLIKEGEPTEYIKSHFFG